MNLFGCALLAMLLLHALALSLFWLLILWPCQRIKARLGYLELEETNIRRRRPDNTQAVHKIHCEVALVRREKRLKWKRKAILQKLYLSIFLPISAGVALLAYAISLLL